MKIKLDGWKKTASDKHHTTMRNAEGHEIRIFHSKLSPKFRGQLAALPLADGGDVPDTQVPKLESSSGDDSGGSKGGGGASSLMKLAPMMLAEGGKAQDDRANDQDLVDSTQNDDLARMVEKESMDKRARGGKIKMYADPQEKVSADDSAPSTPPQPAPATVNINVGGGMPQMPAPGSDPALLQQQSAPSEARQSAPQRMSPEAQAVQNSPAGISPEQMAQIQQGSAPTSAESAPQNAQSQAPTQQSAPQGSAEGAPSQMPPTVQGGPGAGQVPQDSPMPEAPMPSAPVTHNTGQALANQQNQDRQNFIKAHTEDAQAFANDLSNGHISPKSYGEIADKHTLGRIGTMFGMLLGGIGSGLSGQPNILMGMMDKEIDRDLDAQQKSKSNAQNLYNLASQRISSEAGAGLTDAQAQALKYTTAKSYYQQLLLHKFMGMVSKLPPGPQRQQAEASIGMMANQIANGDYQVLDKIHAMGMLTGGGMGSGGGDPEEAAFQSRNKAMAESGDPATIAKAQWESERHLSGIPGLAGQTASRPMDESVRGTINAQNILDHKVADVLDFAHKTQFEKNPLQRIKNDRVGAQKAEELVGYLNQSNGGGILTDGRLKWLKEQTGDNPSSIWQNINGHNDRLREIQRSNQSRQDDLLNSYGLKKPKASSSSSGSANVAEGTPGVFKGKPVIFTGGKWSYK